MKTAVLALCLLGAVVAALALDPSSCTSSNSPTIGSCIKGTVSGNANRQLIFLLSQEQAADPTTNLVIYLWNIDQTSTNAWTGASTGSPATIVTPHTDTTTSSPTGGDSFDQLIRGVTTGTTQTTTGFMLKKTYSATAKCAGNYNIYIDNTASGDFAWGLLVRLEPANPENVFLAKGASWEFTDQLLPGESAKVYLDADFNTYQYPVSAIGATLTPGGDSAKAPPSGNRVTIWSTSTNLACGVALKQLGTSLPNIPFSATACSAPTSARGAYFQFTAPGFTTSDFNKGYNWQQNGPFLNGKITIDTITDFPSIGSSAQSNTIKLKNKDSNNNLITTDDQYVYMLEVPANWWKISISTTQEDASKSDAVVNSPVTVKYSWSTSVTGNPWTAGQYGTSYSFTENGIYNGDFYTSNGVGKTGTVKRQYLAPGTMQGKKYMMFYVAASNCDSTNTVKFTVNQASVSPIEGECKSYTDCYNEPGEATKTRSDFSANGDADRMTHCAVVSSVKDFVATPTTQCVECTSDCECNEGQYCYSSDEGLCSVNGRQWVCDSWANQRRNLCVKKSTDVLGSRCRTDQATALTTTTTWYTNTIPSNNLLVQAEKEVTVGGDDDFSTNSDITGYGFCGEVRYWNSTSGANPGYKLGTGQMVRSVSWKGRCFNKVCQECRSSPGAGSVTSYTSCSNDRRCINGKILNNIYVDNTVRTYTKNTVAGTILGGVMMVILLNLCTLIHIIVTKTSGGGTSKDVSEPNPMQKVAATAGQQ